MSWLSRHAPSIEACAASATAMIALIALIGVKFQLDEADRLQRAQSAREAYRAHLALAATLPEFAEPENGCLLLESNRSGAYVAFVDHLLYSAEQMLDIDEDWEGTFLSELSAHTALLCSTETPIGETQETIRLLKRFQSLNCTAIPICD